jgi:adenylate kinase family enzyme
MARELARLLGCPYVELDAMFHQPGWSALGDDEFRARVDAATVPPAWVVDGNYSTVRDIVWDRADTVVWLDLPFFPVMSRTIRRTVRRTVLRTPLWNGNFEPFSNLLSIKPEKSIIVWSATRHARYHRTYGAAQADPRWDGLTFTQLRSSTQVEQFLKNAERFGQHEGVR